MLRETCPLDAAAEAKLIELVEQRRTMSARSIGRVIEVARTLADLEGREHIDARCLIEASSFRAAPG